MPENGYLSVRVYASEAELPLEGVAVTVTQPSENGTRLLAARLTDESGKIAQIAIPAPDRSESQSPGTPTPWTTVDITADHPNYERFVVENVQIFAGTQTEQNLALIPHSRRPEAWNLTEIFNVTAQPL